MNRPQRKTLLPNFVECATAEEANRIDLVEYRFERYSESKQRYIFARRASRLGMEK